MTHKRTNIRDEIVTQIINASTAAGSNVFPNRYKPIEKSDLPIINVYTLSEDVKENARAVRFEREMQLVIEAYDQETKTEAIDLRLDDISEKIEDALKDFKPACANAKLDLSGTQVNIRMEGDTQVGSIQLTYIVRYSTNR